MKTTQDLPIDPLGSLGHPIRQAPAAKPDTVKPFESGTWTPTGSHIANAKSAQQTIADALKPRHLRDEQACDFGEFGGYVESLLGCI